MTPDYYIQNLQLQPHPEGGFFKEVYRSEEQIDKSALPSRFQGKRSISTSIYFLLQRQDMSAFHKIQSDEIWHFYDGDPLVIYVISLQGELKTYHLGNNLEEGNCFQLVIPAQHYFGACLDENYINYGYTLVGCTVAPGFDFEDFELANRESLLLKYQQHEKIIKKLTKN